MDYNKKTIIAFLIALALIMTAAVPVSALKANKSNLWFGGDKGIEDVWKTGKNLAYTKKDTKIDPHMTARARNADHRGNGDVD